MLWNDKKWLENMHTMTPFVPEKVRKVGDKAVISFGLGSFGYDISLTRNFKVYKPNDKNTVLDPKNIVDSDWKTEEDVDHIVIEPGHFVLGQSIEWIKIPGDCMALFIGKSTMARCGVMVNITPGEAGWEGNLAIEIHNNGAYPVKIYSEEGIAQCIMFEGDTPLKDYGKNGKYQNQVGIVFPRV